MKKYGNIILNKPQILKDNKGKIGVYRLINIITNKSYVGSSINLSNRLKNYYSISYLNNKVIKYNSRIYMSILKYNHISFRLEILEYCDKEILRSREQYHMDLLQPEYNIYKKAGSNLGFKHSGETLLKFRPRVSKSGYVKVAIVNCSNHTV